MTATETVNARTIAEMEDFIGQEIAVSEWTDVPQNLIDDFGSVTNDTQWIHTDPVRAAADSPYGATIAHGFLLLSFLTSLQRDAKAWPSDISAIVNYGLENVRFVSPVVVGSRIRNRATLSKMEHRDNGGVFLQLDNVLEIEGGTKPALVASSLLMVFPEQAANG